MASELLNTLTASGVDWADEMTAYVMGGLVADGKISQRTADIMRSLSVRDEPVIVTTAEQCQVAFETESLSSQWVALQNDGGINAALSTGDRSALKAALAAAIEVL
jgi:hypothetical protein